MSHSRKVDQNFIFRAKTLSIFNEFLIDIRQRVKVFFMEMYPPKNILPLKPDSYEHHLLKKFYKSENGDEKLEPGLKQLIKSHQHVITYLQTGFDENFEIITINAIHGFIIAIEQLFLANCHRDYFRWRLLEISILHNRCVDFYEKLYTHFKTNFNSNSSPRRFPAKYTFHRGQFVPGDTVAEPQLAPIPLFDPTSAVFVPPVTPPRRPRRV